jgi:polysaccharide biosynthesis transport protein
MNNRARELPTSGMSLGDIYYTLFRRKWLILGFVTAGFLVAAVLYLVTPKMYHSEAMILLSYILENKTANPTEANAQVRNMDLRSETIINGEQSILLSLDLATQVADLVGPKEILDKVSKGTNSLEAARFIQTHLTITLPGKGNLIQITLEHPDPGVPQKVLHQLLESYFKRHVEIHRSPGFLEDILAQQTDALKSSLLQIEDQLRKTKASAGVTSLEDARKIYSEQRDRILEEMLTAETELAERLVGTNEVQANLPQQTEALAKEIGAPQDKLDAYRNSCLRLLVYRNNERAMLVRNTEENPLVIRLREQIAEANKEKSRLETDYPKLADPRVRAMLIESPADMLAPTSSAARIASLQARTNALRLQLERLQTQAAKVDLIEPTIVELQRKKNLTETNLYLYSASLEQSRMAEARGPGKISNIKTIQSPTPPALSPGKILKPLLLVMVAGIIGGIGLAFLLETYIDQAVKRPSDLESRLNVPLFLTIPRMTLNGQARAALPGPGGTVPEAPPPPASKADDPAGQGALGGAAVAPWDPSHGVHSYCDALRDRLITYFEVNNMTHKPKLVAVTGCSHGAGVSTIAAGLAATLSETGDGNVLLVEMDLANGAAHPFFKGKPASRLMDVLEHDKRDAALIQDNLYVASATEPDDRLPRVLPKRISQLVPKFKASDYDYIIFDMPMVDQRSITPRLTGFMDMTLMVVESEKTQRDAVKRAVALINESGGKFRAILNKYRAYVPEGLHREY